jgi:DNA-binding NtrC family response regulator
MEPINLLVVNDDPRFGGLLMANLHRPGRIRVELVASGAEALERLYRTPVDAVLTDLSMDAMDGIELLSRIREIDSTLPVIIMSDNPTLERAVEGIQAGATDFLPKPLNVDALRAIVERAVGERPLREEVRAIEARKRATVESILSGSHPLLDAVREFVRQVARSPHARILITGESGTGKSILARAVHVESGATGRFVEVNCAALPGHLLESELFGYEKGAFTDAKAMKRGLIEAAERGTLLLDEIGALPLDLQAKLLTYLESREIRRVGGVDPIPVRTRVVAATNEDLREMVAQNTFREDLLYRLDVASVEMPPLRRMPEVVTDMAERFVAEVAEELVRPVSKLDPDCLPGLREYAWPGNVRELRNAVERAIIFHRKGLLCVRPPAEPPPAHRNGIALERGLTLEEVERRYIMDALEAGEDGLEEAASRLGISRKTLWEKRRRYGLLD